MWNAIHAYQSTRKEIQTAPTRAQALAEAYSALEKAFEEWDSPELVNDHYSREIVASRAKLLIMGLLAGMDAGESPIQKNLRGLLGFLLDITASADPQRWKSARTITGTLREAFASIEEEGTQMERMGLIPRLVESGNLSLRA
jgi:hypothetical protein